ncbi:hypothetical protein NC652_035883 [Populus alba x Populus x berolinensis]|nr:hypothetical protein NC652_035883 [Populus alba x Populus x berolinensis]
MAIGNCWRNEDHKHVGCIINISFEEYRIIFEEPLRIKKDEGWSKARRLSIVWPLSLSIKNVEISGSCKGILCISDQKCYRDIFLLKSLYWGFKLTPNSHFSGFQDRQQLKNSFALLGFGYPSRRRMITRSINVFIYMISHSLTSTQYEREALESTL